MASTVTELLRRRFGGKKEDGAWKVGETKTQNDFVWYENKLAWSGNYRDYNGWRATEMIDVEGMISLSFNSAATVVNYNYFYDAGGMIVQSFSRQGTVQVPSDAKYMIMSQKMTLSLEMTITRIE